MAKNQSNPPDSKEHLVVGLTVVGALAAGVLGIVFGFTAGQDKHDYMAAGLCLLASAFAFGLLAIAAIRK